METTYYFNHWNDKDSWDDATPNELVDGNESTYTADNNNEHYVHCDTNQCDGSDLGVISKVEIRVLLQNNYLPTQTTRTCAVELLPYFNGNTGTRQSVPVGDYSTKQWSDYFDITNDINAPETWDWLDVQNLDCRVITLRPSSGQVKVYKVEVKVTYGEVQELKKSLSDDLTIEVNYLKRIITKRFAN